MVKDSDKTATADALHSAAVRLLRSARTVDAGMDLDGPRASLLSVLVFGGPRAVTALAAAEQVSPPAITKMVTALERAGLVARRRPGGDRRVVMVEATPAGRDLLERGRAARVRMIADLLAGAPEEDLAVLRRAAEIITAALARSQGTAR